MLIKLTGKLYNSIIRKIKGATAIEYVLIASLISLLLITGYKNVGSGYQKIFNNISNAI